MLFRKVSGYVIPGVDESDAIMVGHVISPPAFELWAALIFWGVPDDAILEIVGRSSRVESNREKVSGEIVVGEMNLVSLEEFAEQVQAVREHVAEHAKRDRGNASTGPVAEFLHARWKHGNQTRCFDCTICYEFERPVG